MTPPIERNRVFQIRASDEELAMLAAIAEAEGVSGADVLRLFIRRTYAERFGDKKPKPRR